MSLVEIRCANCGALIESEVKSGQYRCSYCHALVISVADASIKTDFEIVTPEDMDKYISENRKSFIVNVDDRLEEFDVEAKIINQKIAIAETALKQRKFNVYLLNGLPDFPVVLRLRLLHRFNVVNEYELSLQSRRINENEDYKKLMKLCDEATRATYKIIEEEIEKNILADEQIKKTDELFDSSLFSDAFVYAGEMVKKYPAKALAHVQYFNALWSYLEDKYSGASIDGKYIKCSKSVFVHELIICKHRDEFLAAYDLMKKCPDFEIATYSPYKSYEYDVFCYGKYGERNRSVYLMYMKLRSFNNSPSDGVVRYVKDENKREKKAARKAAKEAKQEAKKAANEARKKKK